MCCTEEVHDAKIVVHKAKSTEGEGYYVKLAVPIELWECRTSLGPLSYVSGNHLWSGGACSMVGVLQLKLTLPGPFV